MRLAELESLPAFVFLGPGFGGRSALLLTGLRPADGGPEVFFAPYEAAGREARRFGGDLCVVDEVELPPPAVLEPRLDAAGHAEAVAAIRAAIAAGDVYQVCLTLRARLAPVPGAALLARMAARGLPRFAAWARLPDGTEFVSASPELLFRIEGDAIVSEPMKGTARPGGREALAASAKDWSELAMITDLVRNDLASICRPRSVTVRGEQRFMTLPYAVQTVSEVGGTLPPGADALDALAALHPGGSVTGAPKGAALAMIRRLERTPRGAYCGALGYSAGGRTTACLLIRTACRDAGGWVYGVGGGIVYESDAAAELDEALLKLGALG